MTLCKYTIYQKTALSNGEPTRRFYDVLLYTHMHIYTYTCRIHTDEIIKTSEDFFKKIYLTLYLKGLCVRGSWRPNGTATY